MFVNCHKFKHWFSSRQFLVCHFLPVPCRSILFFIFWPNCQRRIQILVRPNSAAQWSIGARRTDWTQQETNEQRLVGNLARWCDLMKRRRPFLKNWFSVSICPPFNQGAVIARMDGWMNGLIHEKLTEQNVCWIEGRNGVYGWTDIWWRNGW